MRPPWNNVAKYVVTNTLETADWNNTTLLNGDPAAEQVAKLKQEPGGEITMSGSASLVRALLAAGLVDELNLLFPLILGSGEQFLAAEGERHPLNLVDSATLPNGVLHLTYQSAE